MILVHHPVVIWAQPKPEHSRRSATKRSETVQAARSHPKVLDWTKHHVRKMLSHAGEEVESNTQRKNCEPTYLTGRAVIADSPSETDNTLVPQQPKLSERDNQVPCRLTASR
ncbi:hypothetical protein SAMN06265222_12045 [Neorhodopirellula lusitana]|uniref:Uncharacterized protein n=1 Tax=Neorhodopirellula lusitana TaxID=445327 RepID=A0ABY1QMZ2_9BACT|nr:hypothetical protein SAMN06265222_12045 [Neorhodopirellula lusitana]